MAVAPGFPRPLADDGVADPVHVHAAPLAAGRQAAFAAAGKLEGEDAAPAGLPAEDVRTDRPDMAAVSAGDRQAVQDGDAEHTAGNGHGPRGEGSGKTGGQG